MEATAPMQKGSSYLLDRTPEEANRLNEQHRLFILKTGLLHPSIPRAKSVLRVADIGTGTGAWLLEVASKALSQSPEASSYQYRGFDLSLVHFPLSSTLPKGLDIKFHQHDILQPFPSHFQFNFDIAHIRLLFLALSSPSQWSTALSNTTKVLKFCGWLQWVEIDMSSSCVVPISTNPVDVARIRNISADYQKLLDAWAPRQASFALGPQMARMVEDSGLEKVQSCRYVWHEDPVSKEMLVGMNRNAISVYRNAWPAMLQRFGPIKALGLCDTDSITRLIDRIEREIGGQEDEVLRGAFSMDIWTVIGQKNSN